ncbi:MAG: winged helix-turn-helix domain-containing protein [Acidimicrobiia bacterium]|nr:winged helix-turn-helix domain-containing protein [Acidimicrobiia bacterium]
MAETAAIPHAEPTSGSGPTVAVLGPCRSRRGDGRRIELSQLQRRLVARLALSSPGGVSAERMIDDLWPDDPPRTARAALQNQVSRIRGRVGDGVIETTAAGYRLGARTDVDRVGRGRPRGGARPRPRRRPAGARARRRRPGRVAR